MKILSTLAGRIRELPYIFYEEMRKDGRVPIAKLAKIGRVTRNTASEHLNRCFVEKILYFPQFRLRMTQKAVEYIYLLKVKDPLAFLPLLTAEKWIFYYCLLGGSFNILFSSYEPVKVSHLEGFEKVILGGVRSNLVVPEVKRCDLNTAVNKILMKSEKTIEPSLFSMEFPQGSEWTPELWDLYHCLKYNIRMKFKPLLKMFEFKTSTFYSNYKKILEQTDIYVPFYPLKEPAYSSFYFLFNTKYQHFLTDCFAEIPATTLHLRIKDSLLSYIRLPSGSESESFFRILSQWLHTGIVDSYELAVPFYSDGYIPQPGSPCPPPPPPTSPSGITPPGGRNIGDMLSFSI